MVRILQPPCLGRVGEIEALDMIRAYDGDAKVLARHGVVERCYLFAHFLVGVVVGFRCRLAGWRLFECSCVCLFSMLL